MELIGFLLTIFIGLLFNAFGQIPSAPNKIDANGLRQGDWVIYYDIDFNEIDNPDSLQFYRTISYNNDVPSDTVIDYHANGNIQWKGYLIRDRPDDVIHGRSFYYYENGLIKTQCNHLKGNPSGTWIYYLSNGEYSHQINHSKNELLTWRSNVLNQLIDVDEYLDKISIYYSSANSNNWYAYDLSELGVLLIQRNRITEAIKLIKTSIRVIRRINFTNSKEFAFCLNNLAYAYNKIGNYKKAIDLNLQCLNLRRKIYGNSHLYYALSLNNLATSYLNIESYWKALDYHILSFKILSKLNNDYSCTVLSNIADALYSLSSFDKSIEYSKQALNCWSNYGINNERYFLSVKNLSQSYIEVGDYSNALKLLSECKEYFDNNQMQLSSRYVDLLEKINYIMNEIGNFQGSIEIMNQIIKIHQLNNDKKNVFLSTLELCNVHIKINQLIEANELYNAYLKNMKYDSHLELAKILFQLGNYKKSNILLRKSTDYWNTVKFPRAKILESLTYLKLGKRKRATTSCLEATNWLFLIEKDKEMLLDYFTLLCQLHQYDLCDKIGPSFTKLFYSDFLSSFFGLTIVERQKFKSTFNFSRETLLNYALFRKNYNSELFNDVYEYWMNNNGLLNNISSNTGAQINRSADPQLIRIYDDYRELMQQFALYNEKSKEQLKQMGIDMIALEEQVVSLERELNEKVSGFSNYKKQYTYEDLTHGMEHNEVFLDMILLPYQDTNNWKWTDKKRYLLYLSSPNWVAPKNIIIDNSEGLMECCHDYANRIHGNSTLREMVDTSGRYYDQFWSPIAKELNGIEKVYISLDGVYNNINLATLYNKETGKYLFEELDIEIVNSARSFIESKNKESEDYTDLTATLIGYPDYDQLPKDEVIESEDYYASSRDLTAQLTDSLSRGGRVGSLPGTKTEVETIGETLRKQNWIPTVLMESEASEYAVKRLKSPRVVHMATHGYFLEDIEQEYDENRLLGMDRTKVVENPMLRSGLLFSGANSTLSGTEVQEGENGILTAYEASFLNLENTELVVMSACETAKGEQKTGEGVYGLRKAVSDAGAEHVMMSLWKVDDKVTQEFMTTFYSYWLEDKMPIREAFKSTRLAIKSKYPQPYYWGAFILVGR